MGLIYQDAWIRAKPTQLEGKECSIPLFDWPPSGRNGSAALPSPRDSLIFSADDGSYSAGRPAGGSSVPATIKRWGRKWLLLGHGSREGKEDLALFRANDSNESCGTHA